MKICRTVEDELAQAASKYQDVFRLGVMAAEHFATINPVERAESRPNPYKEGTPRSFAWLLGWVAGGNPEYPSGGSEDSSTFSGTRSSAGPVKKSPKTSPSHREREIQEDVAVALAEDDPEPGTAGWVDRG